MIAQNLSFGIDDEAVGILRVLISVNLDSRDCYLEAADHIDDDNIRVLFTTIAKQRDHLANSLQNVLWADQRELSENESRRTGDRPWMNLQAAFGTDAATMAREIERIEAYIAGQYESARRKVGGRALLQLLSEQHRLVLRGRERVRVLYRNIVLNDECESS